MQSMAITLKNHCNAAISTCYLTNWTVDIKSHGSCKDICGQIAINRHVTAQYLAT